MKGEASEMPDDIINAALNRADVVREIMVQYDLSLADWLDEYGHTEEEAIQHQLYFLSHVLCAMHGFGLKDADGEYTAFPCEDCIERAAYLLDLEEISEHEGVKGRMRQWLEETASGEQLPADGSE